MKTFAFGPWPIAATEVFFTSALSLGIVNFKPLVPPANDISRNKQNAAIPSSADVLVLPRRVCPRFADLTREEVSDLFLSAHTIGKQVETHYKAEALTITIQDGVRAGQTVPHVHIHIIPRRAGDWADNNDIYPELDDKERELAEALKRKARKIDDDARKQRTPDDMAAEARDLRALFEQSEDVAA
ncbi:hypothetical protein HDU86_007143 [Geranomyces michiganensis]|nr:hypothetical protein HDU86_007143 [Geranomyces michiganensis]